VHQSEYSLGGCAWYGVADKELRKKSACRIQKNERKGANEGQAAQET